MQKESVVVSTGAPAPVGVSSHRGTDSRLARGCLAEEIEKTPVCRLTTRVSLFEGGDSGPVQP